MSTTATATVTATSAQGANMKAAFKKVATKTVATKTAKPNPSAALIGMKLTSADAKSVNFRQGKTNIVSCNTIEVLGANATGRRLEVIFKDATGKEIMKRRVYKEHFEKMADIFGVII
jgi:hypothetical protein